MIRGAQRKIATAEELLFVSLYPPILVLSYFLFLCPFLNSMLSTNKKSTVISLVFILYFKTILSRRIMKAD